MINSKCYVVTWYYQGIDLNLFGKWRPFLSSPSLPPPSPFPPFLPLTRSSSLPSSHLPRPMWSTEHPALGHRLRSPGVTCGCVLTTCSQRKSFSGRGNSVGIGEGRSSGTTEGGASVQVGGRAGRVEGVWLCCCSPHAHPMCGWSALITGYRVGLDKTLVSSVLGPSWPWWPQGRFTSLGT